MWSAAWWLATPPNNSIRSSGDCKGIWSRELKRLGRFDCLIAGGPKELFPYLDPDLAGVYLSGAARVSGESFRLGLLNAREKPVPGNCLEPRFARSGDAVVGVQVGEEFIGADAVIVAAGAWSTELCKPLDVHFAS